MVYRSRSYLFAEKVKPVYGQRKATKFVDGVETIVDEWYVHHWLDLHLTVFQTKHRPTVLDMRYLGQVADPQYVPDEDSEDPSKDSTPGEDEVRYGEPYTRERLQLVANKLAEIVADSSKLHDGMEVRSGRRWLPAQPDPVPEPDPTGVTGEEPLPEPDPLELSGLGSPEGKKSDKSDKPVPEPGEVIGEALPVGGRVIKPIRPSDIYPELDPKDPSCELVAPSDLWGQEVRMSYARYLDMCKMREMFSRDNIVVFSRDSWEKILPKIAQKGQVVVPRDRVLPEGHVAVPAATLERIAQHSETTSRLGLVLSRTSEVVRAETLDAAHVPVSERTSLKELKDTVVEPKKLKHPVPDVKSKLDIPPAKKGQTNCVVCGKFFATKRALNQHQLSHQGARQWECPSCGQMQSTKRSYDEHIAFCVHGKAAVCQYCNKGFIKRSTRDRHIKQVHQKDKKAAAVPCKFGCGKTYSNPSSREVHQRDCPSDKDYRGPYKCQLCDATRTRKADLTAHVRYSHQIAVWKPLPKEKE